MMRFECAVAATRGARDYQEDTAAYWPGGDDPFVKAAAPGASRNGHTFAVLADGMGGHAGGALASRMVCETFLGSVVANETAGEEHLLAGLEVANAALAAKVDESPALSGMGSTLIGVSLTEDGMKWVSVGDSPLLLFRRGEVAQVNEDHSLAPELDRMVAEGRLTAEEARRDSRRHMLRSAVSGDEIDLVDFSRVPLAVEGGDFVVLASDGIATLESGEIARIIAGYANDGPSAVARALIRAIDAHREPHQDNATVVVVGVG